MVANYWKGFLAAISASFMSHVIDMISTRDVSATFDPLFYVDYDTNKTYEVNIPPKPLLRDRDRANLTTSSSFARLSTGKFASSWLSAFSLASAVQWWSS